MALVANSGANVTRYPPAVVFLGAQHWSWKYLAPSELSKIFAFLFEVIDEKLVEAVADAEVDDPDAAESSIVDAVLAESDPPSTGERLVALDPRNVLAALLYLPHDTPRLIGVLVSWLLRTNPPERVLSAAHAHIHAIQRTDWLHLLGHREYSMVPRLVSTLATRCLELPGFTEHMTLVHLCTLCLLHTPSIRSRPPAGFVFFARPVLAALLAALAHVDVADPDCAVLLKDVLEVRRSVEEDILWKDGKAEVVAGFDRLLAFGTSSFTQRLV
ncbi:hypothetical protein B0H17DRAFT_318499 [Mycena rosella]|uniref:Uncharacterized protein n=1 Tax=Mycena rosella TaxID=1033263 RepID=A0AAD7CTF0_MYCRO|nr:hypothetical protein B0H17DRAFT_318499 [Mycena rosella]